MSQLQKAVLSGTKTIGMVGDVVADEALYRERMKAEGNAMAQQKSTLDGLLESIATLEKASRGVLYHDALPEGLEELKSQASEVAASCMYHVCFYTALTLFRNPKTVAAEGREGKSLSCKLQTVLHTIDQMPRREHWKGAVLLDEMQAAVRNSSSSSKQHKKRPAAEKGTEEGKAVEAVGPAPLDSKQRKKRPAAEKSMEQGKAVETVEASKSKSCSSGKRAAPKRTGKGKAGEALESTKSCKRAAPLDGTLVAMWKKKRGEEE